MCGVKQREVSMIKSPLSRQVNHPIGDISRVRGPAVKMGHITYDVAEWIQFSVSIRVVTRKYYTFASLIEVEVFLFSIGFKGGK